MLAIHQPNYLPYLGFFHKIARADVMILYDTAQYSKNGFHNRNRIKTPRGAQWLTVPVKRRSSMPLKEVEIKRSERWGYKHVKSVEANYHRAPWYSAYSDDLASILLRDWLRLVDLNIALIERISRWLAITPEVVLASELPPLPSGMDTTEKVISLTKAVGGDTYLSGSGGRDYLVEGKFVDIVLEFDNFFTKPYPQQFGNFVPNLSVLDALMNCGEGTEQFVSRATWP